MPANNAEGIDGLRYSIVKETFTYLSYKDRITELNELKSDYDYNSNLLVSLKELQNFDLTLEDWTKATERISTANLGLTSKLNLELKKGVYNKFHKIKMSDLFEKKVVWNFPVTTIHKVKGMTLDSILLFLNKNKQSISLADIEFKKPELT